MCSPNCISDTCRPTDGLCTCAEGWTGHNCTTGTFLKLVLDNITEIELSQLIHVIIKQSLKHCKHVFFSIMFIFCVHLNLILYIFYIIIYILNDDYQKKTVQESEL